MRQRKEVGNMEIGIEIKVTKVEGGYKLIVEGDLSDPEWDSEHVAETDEKLRNLVNKALDQLFSC